MKQRNVMALMLLGISMPLWSQENRSDEPDQEVNEQPLMVVSSEEQALPVPLVDEAATINVNPGGVSLFTQSVWESQKATNIKDLLDYVPGLFVQQRNGAESARVSVRGSGLGRVFQGGGLQLRYDGIPLNAADGSFDFQAIDPWLIDYITVRRGGNAMARGGSTLGGVVNFGTIDASADDPVLLRLTAGSFDTVQGMLGLGLSDSESRHAMRLRASHFDQAGFRDQNRQRSNRFDWQHVYRQNQQTSHKTSLYHLNTHAELPSSLSKGLLFADPRQSRGFNIRGNFHRDLTLTRLAYRLKHQTRRQSEVELAMFYAAKRLINPVFTHIKRDSDDMGLQFAWRHGDHTLSLYSQFGTQDELRRENELGLPGPERLLRDQKAQTTTVTYQNQQSVINDQLTATWAIQGVYAQRDITEIRPVYLESDRHYSQINPRFGLLYQSDQNRQWFGNLTRSFEAPTFAELNNGNQPGVNASIKAQRADTIELGTRGVAGALSWDVAVYYSLLENEFIRFRFPDGATRTTNAEDSVHLGLESAMQWQLADSMFSESDQVSIRASYQWSQFKLDDHPVHANNDIPGVPEHYIQTQLVYQHPSGWQISPNMEWVPTAYYIDLANTYRTDNYLLTGLTVSYTSPKGWSFYLDAKNLNDQVYISTSLPIPDAGGTDGNYFYSGEGRAVYAGLKWRF